MPSCLGVVCELYAGDRTAVHYRGRYVRYVYALHSTAAQNFLTYPLDQQQTPLVIGEFIFLSHYTKAVEIH